MTRIGLNLIFLSFLSISLCVFGGFIVTGNTASFSGDLSSGVTVGLFTNPSSWTIYEVNINNVLAGTSVPGVTFYSTTGNNVFINSGSSQETVTMTAGIFGLTVGTPSGTYPNDDFLNVPLIGQDPAVGGGMVNITNYSTITTNASEAHGIRAYSSSDGYPTSVTDALAAFTETAFSFEVTQVTDPDGQVVAFEPDDTVEVRGVLVDADGQPILDDDENPIEHGTFTIDRDGTFSVVFSAEETAEHTALETGESISIAVNYAVEGDRAGNTQSDNGKLFVVFLRDDEGTLVETKESYFETFGISTKPARMENPTIFPDLEQYIDDLLADVTVGGGGGVTVTNNDDITTQGALSHGIYAQSQGSQGAGGRGGSIGHSAGAGSAGETPGKVIVNADGTITTQQDESNGVMALSAGGAGGPGGNGGHWRHGQKGGTGGTGGEVEVNGSATITTDGDYSSGIVAFSVGGNGGSGGSGSGAMPGGGGGYGGMGGDVILDGSWDITTDGDMAHGIWAKSLGGNAGNGGSGGWLFGRPGGGGAATDGGDVNITSRGEINTSGTSSYGIYAQSVGGFGGGGGTSWGLFWSFGGNADSGGSGGNVDVTNMTAGRIITDGDYSHAILAQSIGGGGGSGGGKFSLLASLGGTGASGGNGGNVTVENDGYIETKKIGSYGILAQSVGGGGGDGGSTAGLVAIGGNGSQTSDGGAVEVTNRGTIITRELYSHAIFAESIGGGGGNGGRSGGMISIGGNGGAGGNADTVTVTNEGTIHTVKDESYGIFAQSVGGSGGNGGGAISIGAGASVSIGGNGASGGSGDIVTVTTEENSSIITEGIASYGIMAQSVGGGGGAGGFSVSGSFGGSGFNLGIGGGGGTGGLGSTVNINTDGTISTSGLRAHGIFAQSVGGGGGDGGFSVAGSIGSGLSANLAIGGNGGTGNTGGAVNVNGHGAITTQSNDAHGIFAQSVGGSGGNGGFSVAASLGGGSSLNLGFGGDGGNSSSAGKVKVGTLADPFGGTINTYGDRSYGILAQSVGGGGGNGGTTISGAILGPAAISMSFGGDAGSGGLGETVDLYSGAAITTDGLQSHGILAQSVGGGGGAGGLSIAGGVTAFGGLSLAMGGDGGTGNTAGNVMVNNSGRIETKDEYSYGIFAQSVGGCGGAGGTSGAIMANFSSLIPIPPEYPTGSLNISLSLGGDGGTGGAAGRVDVDNTGTIITNDDFSYGILAQSVGGGGGDGGKSIAATANISLPSEPGGAEEPQVEVKVDFAMALGGDGGTGNHGGIVDILNSGTIDTSGDGSHGIFAQSVGGGGGSGGDARSMILSIDPSNWNPGESMPEPGSFSFGATLSVGGKGNVGGDGGQVTVTNTGTITTNGADAFGILAQSVGGGGGLGGGGYHGLDWQDFGVPEEYEQYLDLLPVQDEGDIHITVGGNTGSSGAGKKVTVNNTGSIFTYGDGSVGILVQSIGGGGGIGGVGSNAGDSGEISIGGAGGAGGAGGDIDIDLTGSVYTEGVAAHGIFAQSVGGGGGYAGNTDRGITDFGLNFAMGGDGGAGGDGGIVEIDSTGNITTLGDGAIGIFAQSVGGGGGVGGDAGFGFGFSGSVGNAGDGGRVDIYHTGNITTSGKNAHGIVAQSVGGDDFGGEVIVRIAGDISVSGEGAYAVIAQSEGTAGKQNIDFIYESGTITGNSHSAVHLFEGVDNSFTNHGVITTVVGKDGTAFTATGGNDTIHNYGTVFGSINLGSGVNEFVNYAEATLNSGDTLNLGAGSILANQGIFSPGGNGIISTTILYGNYEQSSTGNIVVDWDMQSGQSDSLDISGTVDLAGQTQIRVLNPGYAVSGTYYMTLLTGAGGVTDSGLSLLATRTAILDYDLHFAPNGTDVQLQAVVDTSPDGLTPQQAGIGDYINRVQASGGADSFSPFAEQLLAMPDVESLGKAYEQLSPASYDLFSTSSTDAANQYTISLVKRMHSVRSAIQTHDQSMAVKQIVPNAAWMEGFGFSADQDAENGFPGYIARTGGTSFGYDYLLDDGLLAGISGGYANTNVDIKDSDSHGDIDSYLGSLYGSWFTEKWYVDSALSYAHHRFNNFRTIEVGGISEGAHSEHDGDALSAYIESGFNIYIEDWLLQPFTAFRCTSLYEESYKESGAAGVNLYVDDRTTQSLLMNLGTRLSRPFKLKDWVVIPEMMVAWDHDFDVDDNRLVTAFDSAPAMKFASEGRDIEKDGILAGFGLTMINKDHVSISVNYNGQFRNNFVSHAFIGGVRIEF